MAKTGVLCTNIGTKRLECLKNVIFLLNNHIYLKNFLIDSLQSLYTYCRDQQQQSDLILE